MKFELSKDSLLLILGFSGMWFGYWGVVGAVQYSMQRLPTLLDTTQVFLSIPLALLCLVAFIFFDLIKNNFGKWLTLSLLISLMVILPTTFSIFDRHNSDRPNSIVHDNSIQVEGAMKFLLSGQDPYGQDYFPIMKGNSYIPWFYDLKGSMPPGNYFLNPAFFHLVSLPFEFVAMIPFWLVINMLLGFFDARFLYLFAYISSLFLGNALVAKNDRIQFTSVFALNPFLAPFVIEGRNDILTIFLIIATLFLLIKKRHFLSMIPLGLAMATKESAWIFGLIYFVLLYFKLEKKHFVKFITLILIGVLTSLALIEPFFIWNPTAFINDTFKYVAGGTQHAYPLKGYGFSILLLTLGWIQNSLSDYPATIFEILFGLPVLGASIYLVKKQPTIKTLLMTFSFSLFTILFFSRFLLDNYLGIFVSFIILAYFINPKIEELNL